MQVEKYSIKETKEIFRAIAGIRQAYKISIAGGQKFDFKKHYLNFIAPLTLIPPAIDRSKMAPKEWGDLSETEILELRDEFGEIVENPLFQKAFFHFVSFGDSIIEIVRKEGLEVVDEDSLLFLPESIRPAIHDAKEVELTISTLAAKEEENAGLLMTLSEKENLLKESRAVVETKEGIIRQKDQEVGEAQDALSLEEEARKKAESNLSSLNKEIEELRNKLDALENGSKKTANKKTSAKK